MNFKRSLLGRSVDAVGRVTTLADSSKINLKLFLASLEDLALF
jgi:hypothetical protein